MVTPCMSANCAQSMDPRHESYARMCVVAFWRLMPTSERYKLLTTVQGIDAVDRRRYGSTIFEEPHVVAGFPLKDRYLGVRDLVEAFEGSRRKEIHWFRASAEDGGDGQWTWRAVKLSRGVWKYGWAMALMEMLADPMLVEWVPSWIVEQYERWNSFFRDKLQDVLTKDQEGKLSNREVLQLTKVAMNAAYRKEKKLRAEGEDVAEEDDKEELGDGEVAPDADSDGSGKSGDDDDDDPAAAVIKVWQSEAVPCADDDPEAPVGGDRWANLTLEERFSAAPPAAAVPDRMFGTA